MAAVLGMAILELMAIPVNFRAREYNICRSENGTGKEVAVSIYNSRT